VKSSELEALCLGKRKRIFKRKENI